MAPSVGVSSSLSVSPSASGVVSSGFAESVFERSERLARPASASGDCADGRPPSRAALDAIASDSFSSLASILPSEAVRCASAFGAPPEDVLFAAMAAAPFDAAFLAVGSLRWRSAALAASSKDRLASASSDDGTGARRASEVLAARFGTGFLRGLSSSSGSRLDATLSSTSSDDASELRAWLAARRTMDLLDERVDEAISARLAPLSGLSAGGLLGLLSRTSDDAYASSYDAAFDRLSASAKLFPGGWERLLERLPSAATRSFFSIAASRGRLSDVLSGMDQGLAARRMASVFFSVDEPFREPVSLARLDSSVPFRAAALADAASSFSSPSILNEALAERLLALRDGSPERARAEVISSLFVALRGDGGALANALSISGGSAPFDASSIPSPPEEAFFREGLNVQRFVFYDDADGRATWERFRRLRKAAGWSEERRSGFSVLRSPSRNGRSIAAIADVPGGGALGRSAADAWLRDRWLIPSIVAHRGHSYHEDSTMELLKGTEVLVAWGSCGSYARLRETFVRSPNAQVLATRDIGRAKVNDALFGAIDELLLSTGSIDWGAAWALAAGGAGPGFRSYVRPDEAFSARAARAWLKARSP
jgi:hypothetical protein